MSRSVLIIGGSGQLGRSLRTVLPQASTVGRAQLDISDSESLDRFDWAPFQVVINAAAWTDVDGAELSENREAVWSANASGPARLATIAGRTGIRLIHFSSDYVFDGTKASYTELAPLSPLSVYGAAKAAGDLAVSTLAEHYIFRTSWVIGDGKNFVRTMQQLAKSGVSPKVVNDQRGRLTFSDELARAVVFALESSWGSGVYNLTNAGDVVSWHEVAREIFRLSGRDPEDVTGVTTQEYYQGKSHIAPRPLSSNLSLEKVQAAGYQPSDWRDALRNYMTSKGEV